MHNIKPLLLALGACSIISCNNNRSLSTLGYEFVHHHQNLIETPVEGDQVVFHIDTYHGKEQIQSSRTQSNPASLWIRSTTQSPLEEALSAMSIGDSMSVFTRIDTLYPRYVIDASLHEIEYRIKLIDIVSKDKDIDKRTASK